MLGKPADSLIRRQLAPHHKGCGTFNKLIKLGPLLDHCNIFLTAAFAVFRNLESIE